MKFRPILFSPDMVNAIAQATPQEIWVHLMVTDPGHWLDRLDLPDKSLITFHFESNEEISGMIAHIKEKRWRASLAINPKTPVAEILPWLDAIDHILLMSVEPGFSGQRFLPDTMTKLADLVGHCQRRESSCKIGIDGGITLDLVGPLTAAGAHDLAVASALFNVPDPVAALHAMQEIIRSA